MRPLHYVLLALAGGAAAAAMAEPVPVYDRSSLYSPTEQLSDDPRRTPLPTGTGIPKTTVVLTNARLFDGTGKPARAADILIVGKTVQAIASPGGLSHPSGADVIDLGGRTVIPGLIDMHTHLTYVFQFGLPDETSERSPANAALRGMERLRYYVESGITAVRDTGSHGHTPFMLKQWVQQGRIPGPRVFAAGQVIVGEGGHGAEGFTFARSPEFRESIVRVASGPDDFRSAVREQFRAGADLIKIASHFTPAEIEAAVDEAHRLGLRVTVDSETVYTEMAVKAGADTIEHPLPRSEETIRLMAKNGVSSIPTIIPYQDIIAKRGGYFGSTSRRFTLNEQVMFDMTRRMKQAGVKLGVGTDLITNAYEDLPKPYVQELKNFMQLGYTPAEALVAATRTNAEILGMDDRLGTLQVGKLADLVVVNGKPDQNIEDVANVEMVIVNGSVVVREGRVYVPRSAGKKAAGAQR